MDYSKIISKRIEMYCKEQGITINKFAKLTGMAQSTIDNIIKNNSKNPRIRTLHRISRGLGITLSELLELPENQ